MIAKKVHGDLRRHITRIFSVLTLISGILMLIFSGAASEAVMDALSVCANILIPALFPFMVFSVFVVKSGLSETLGRYLAPTTRFLFKLPGSTAAVILTGWMGGYPAAARGISALVENNQISRAQAERMTSFCICAGPSFVLSAVGIRMLGSVEIGLLLYAAQISTALLIGFIGARFVKKVETPPPRPSAKNKSPFLTGALIGSVDDGVRSMLMMCALVCICSVLSALLNSVGITALFRSILDNLGLSSISGVIPSILLEVTDGCRTAVQAGGSHILLCALALAWGGLCIHLQIFSSLRHIKLRFGRFFLFRLLQTLLSVLLTALLLHLFPQPVATVFSTFSQTPEPSAGQNGIWACLSLMAMAVIFLFSTSTKDVSIHKKKWYDIRKVKREEGNI